MSFEGSYEGPPPQFESRACFALRFKRHPLLKRIATEDFCAAATSHYRNFIFQDDVKLGEEARTELTTVSIKDGKLVTVTNLSQDTPSKTRKHTDLLYALQDAPKTEAVKTWVKLIIGHKWGFIFLANVLAVAKYMPELHPSIEAGLKDLVSDSSDEGREKLRHFMIAWRAVTAHRKDPFSTSEFPFLLREIARVARDNDNPGLLERAFIDDEEKPMIEWFSQNGGLDTISSIITDVHD